MSLLARMEMLLIMLAKDICYDVTLQSISPFKGNILSSINCYANLISIPKDCVNG